MELDKICIFEKNKGIAVNVLDFQKSKIYPLRLNETSQKTKCVVNLPIINEDKNKQYSLIMNMSKLLMKQLSKHDGAKVFQMKRSSKFLMNR